MCAARAKKKSAKKSSRAKTRAKSAMRSVKRANAAATADSSQRQVIEAAVELSGALHRQSTDTATWIADEISLWRDERRETTALIQAADAPGSKLPLASSASCNESIAASNAATEAVSAAESRATMLTALVLTNNAQRLLGDLIQGA
jgi:hypothetical protein